MNKQPIVVIVGRINVGKSSLFNRLTDSSKALISQIAGTTRDYNMGQVDWRKKSFQVIDTGGVNVDILKNSIQTLLPNYKEKKYNTITEIDSEIVAQTKNAIAKAKMIIMVVDGQAGVLPEDKELALVLKKLDTPTLLVCNKIDNQRHTGNLADFFKLGLGDPHPLSAANGSGVGDFLDVLVKKIKWPVGRPSTSESERGTRVSIIGKPNAGKSSLVNQILGEKRVIVSKTPHTTRDPQDTEITYKKQKIVLIDTAGLRKKAKIESGLEKMSTRKTWNVTKSADIVILVTEVDRPLTKQDSALAGLLKELSTGIILVSNKWDLIDDKHAKIDTDVIRQYKIHFPYLSFVPMIFISAKTGRNVDKILDLILEVDKHRRQEISDEDLEVLKNKFVKIHKPAQGKGTKRPHVYALKQVGSNPPIFIVTVGAEDTLHFSYIRFIENQIRDKFDFTGVPIKLIVKTIKR